MSKDAPKDKVVSPYLFIMGDIMFNKHDTATAIKLIEARVSISKVDEAGLELAEHMRRILADIPDAWQMYICSAALAFVQSEDIDEARKS